MNEVSSETFRLTLYLKITQNIHLLKAALRNVEVCFQYLFSVDTVRFRLLTTDISKADILRNNILRNQYIMKMQVVRLYFGMKRLA